MKTYMHFYFCIIWDIILEFVIAKSVSKVVEENEVHIFYAVYCFPCLDGL